VWPGNSSFFRGHFDPLDETGLLPFDLPMLAATALSAPNQPGRGICLQIAMPARSRFRVERDLGSDSHGLVNQSLVTNAVIVTITKIHTT
jgi:hypothetical protein